MSVTVWWTPRPGDRRGRILLRRAGVTVALLAAGIGLLALTPGYRWEWGRIWGPGRSGWTYLVVQGLLTTLGISLAGMLLGLVLGFAGGLARLSRRPTVQQVATTYVEVVRGTPFFVQLIVAYYCVAPAVHALLLHLGVPEAVASLVQRAEVVGTVALAVFSGAYITEIVRAAIQSIDPGQTEAAFAQGLSRGQVLRLVLVPQAIPRMLPPLAGELVNLVKDSSLLSYIAVEELTKRAQGIHAATYKTFEVFLPLMALYLAITFPLSRLARRLEFRLA
jgi:polar amino acid transport system permease protein